MNFLVDECVDLQLVNFLREDGHDVLYVMESMRGEADDVILTRAYREQRILLTEDKDFGELVYRLRMPAVCIVLLRFSPSEEQEKLDCLRNLVTNHMADYEGKFFVVTPNNIRIRMLEL